MVNFAELNQMVDKYAGQPFQILGFPCNQFLEQSPGTDEEFMETIRYVRPGNNYIPKFPIFSMVDVNGENSAPVFSFLRNVCPQTPTGVLGDPQYIIWSPVTISDLAWNFEKFLVDKHGSVIHRYATAVNPNFLELDINALLKKN